MAKMKVDVDAIGTTEELSRAEDRNPAVVSLLVYPATESSLDICDLGNDGDGKAAMRDLQKSIADHPDWTPGIIDLLARHDGTGGLLLEIHSYELGRSPRLGDHASAYAAFFAAALRHLVDLWLPFEVEECKPRITGQVVRFRAGDGRRVTVTREVPSVRFALPISKVHNWGMKQEARKTTKQETQPEEAPELPSAAQLARRVKGMAEGVVADLIHAVLAHTDGVDGWEEYKGHLQQINDRFREILGVAIGPLLNNRIKAIPQATLEEKRLLCKWLNAELADLGLAVLAPEVNRPARLIAGYTGKPEGNAGRFDFEYDDAESGRPRKTSRTTLPPLHFTPIELRRGAGWTTLKAT